MFPAGETLLLKMTNKTTPAKKAQSAVNKTAKKINSAGAMLAAGFIYGQDAINILTSLDQTITDLANLKLPDGKCKSLEGKTEEESYLDKQLAALKGCAPYAQTFSDAYNADDPGEKLEKTTTGLLQLAESILSVQGKEAGLDKMLDCAEAQYRKFLAAIPVQYFLLIALSKTLKNFKQPNLIAQQVDTPCGEKIKYLKEYENFMPDIQLPLIPRLPYIEIPDITDLIWAIAAEQACYTLCVATTPMVQTVSEVLFSMVDAWAETDDPDYSKVPPLLKVSINSYISDEAILASKQNKLIPSSVSIEDVRSYLTNIQQRQDIGQEEFVFLFLGNANCNILSKLLSTETIVDLGYLTTGKFKLMNEEEIINFFSFLGSYVNFIRLIKDSKLEVCPPDPCELKDDDLEGIVAAVNDLCSLLNPNTTLPPLPINALMKGTGTNDFIVDVTYDSNKLIAESSNAYAAPKIEQLNPSTGTPTTTPDDAEDYFFQYASQAAVVSEELIKGEKTDQIVGLLVEPKETSLVGFKKIKDKKLFDFPWPLPDIYSYKTDYSTIAETYLEDKNIVLAPFEDAANNYWIEDDLFALKFSKSRLTLKTINYEQTSIKKVFANLFYGFIENSFPYTLVDIAFGGYDSDLDAAGISAFPLYQSGWQQKDLELIEVRGIGSIYVRYTRPILKNKLESLQSMKQDKKIEDVTADMLEFAEIKRAFF
tara:strand:- start:4356 stop:6479 length:2124 start_codon:yes stop_codon:yes gene_type:complete